MNINIAVQHLSRIYFVLYSASSIQFKFYWHNINEIYNIITTNQQANVKGEIYRMQYLLPSKQ